MNSTNGVMDAVGVPWAIPTRHGQQGCTSLLTMRSWKDNYHSSAQNEWKWKTIMKIEILGTGCHHCVQLDLLVAEVVQALGLQAVEIRRVDDEREIRHYMPLDASPGLVIEGRLVSERNVPEREALISWLSLA